MKKYSNPYSRYRFLNDGTIKYIVDPYTYDVTTHGAELKNSIYRGFINSQLECDSHLNLGTTTIVNHTQSCTQITTVDQTLNPIAKGNVFFRLFKL